MRYPFTPEQIERIKALSPPVAPDAEMTVDESIELFDFIVGRLHAEGFDKNDLPNKLGLFYEDLIDVMSKEDHKHGYR